MHYLYPFSGLNYNNFPYSFFCFFNVIDLFFLDFLLISLNESFKLGHYSKGTAIIFISEIILNKYIEHHCINSCFTLIKFIFYLNHRKASSSRGARNKTKNFFFSRRNKNKENWLSRVWQVVEWERKTTLCVRDIERKRKTFFYSH